jgi:TonB family protein
MADAQGRQDTRATEYAMLVRHRLEQRGAYPKTARRLGLEGRVEMVLKIDGNGSVTSTTIHLYSGFRELDEAAMASSLSIGLLPPPPDNMAIEIIVPVKFSMRRM